VGPESVQSLKQGIASVADFPVRGIDFKDITPLLADGERFASVIDGMCDELAAREIEFDAVFAVEARGFIFGAPIAAKMRRGLELVRKPGKLPGDSDAFNYSCEYCDGTLEVRRGAVRPGLRALVLDDLLATGGTARAVADHVSREGGVVAAYCFFLELSFLEGRQLLEDAAVLSLVTY
jgi:adenine phosphoribosyltransferase